MNVADLRELLTDFDEDMDVVFGYNYGDHANTMVTQDVHKIDKTVVGESSYFFPLKVVLDEDNEDNYRNKHTVCMIS
jgi:hypothetical protein